jgi:hypothetical protein
MEKRKIKVPVFAKQTGIPKDRVYKWLQQGNNPKAEDEKKIAGWIDGEKRMEKVPQNEKAPAESEDVYRDKYIKLLEDDQTFFKEMLRSSLGSILMKTEEMWARQKGTGEVILGSLERLEKAPKDSLVDEAGRRILEIDKEEHGPGSVAAPGR